MRQSDDTHERVQTLDDPVLLAAMDSNATRSFEVIAERIGGKVYRSPEMTCYLSGLPIAQFNGVALTNLEEEQADSAITETLARFVEARTPMYWWIGPYTRPLDFNARLEAHGLRHTADLPGMAIDITTLGPAQQIPSVRFTQVTNEDEANVWMRSSFGLEPSDSLPGSLQPLAGIFKNGLLAPDSPWSFHLGYLDNRPVSTSIGFLHAGVVGIFGVSTAPTARNRGIGREVTKRALLWARERGYRVGILQATAMGYPVYERLGFKTVATYACYTLHATEPEDSARDLTSS